MSPDKALEVGIEACAFSANQYRACHSALARDNDNAATTLAALRPLVAATLEWYRLRQEMSDFREPISHVDEWCELSSKHVKAEISMRAAYAALAPEGGQT